LPEISSSCYGFHQNRWYDKNLTFATLYHNDFEHLQTQLRSWEKVPSEVVKSILFVVIDDGSQIREARKVIDVTSSCSVDVMLVKITNDISWNIGGARNLAMLVAPTKYVFLTDIDIYAKISFYPHILSLLTVSEAAVNEGREMIFTSFQREFDRNETRVLKPHPAIMLISKQTYWRVGGCDEDFVGNYGFTDPHFWHRAGQTPNVTIVNCHSTHPKIPALQERKQLSSHIRFRDPSANRVLFTEKVAHNSWSDVYVRFPWELEKVSCDTQSPR
jgi:hypothetical protein